MNIIEALRSGRPVKAVIDLRELRFESLWDLSAYITKYDAALVQKILECETWEVETTYYPVTEEELRELFEIGVGTLDTMYGCNIEKVTGIVDRVPDGLIDRIKARGPVAK